jgi:ankyrin repeat protein
MYTFYRAFECLVGNSGSLVNTTTDRLETPLHYACISQQEECVRLLIRAEATVNTLDK